jgi:DNA-binding NtrC family response regulator
MRVEDAGSLNGIHIRRNQAMEETAKVVEQWVPPGENMEVAVGDGLTLGGTLLTIQSVGEEKEPVSTRLSVSFIAPVVQDTAMQQLHKTVDRIAQSSISVLLLGETGVGKEVMAETIHKKSPRAKSPLVCLNCAAFSESLLESELFGHEAGAFTGAHRTKLGLLEAADGGTVFLDEVGELPTSIQVKLLRVLEERKVRRVGSLSPQSFDVRFISATNRDLSAEAQRGTFRQDLFFRLNGISIKIPPLRERQSEIEPIAKSFIRRVCSQMNLRELSITPDALDSLLCHSWPGNIRELRNVIERAVVLCHVGAIGPEHLGLDRKSDIELVADAVSSRTTLPPPSTLGDEERERRKIVEALEKCAGNQTQAAQLLGMARRTLVSRLDAFNIARPRKKG